MFGEKPLAVMAAMAEIVVLAPEQVLVRVQEQELSRVSAQPGNGFHSAHWQLCAVGELWSTSAGEEGPGLSVGAVTPLSAGLVAVAGQERPQESPLAPREFSPHLTS